MVEIVVAVKWESGYHRYFYPCRVECKIVVDVVVPVEMGERCHCYFCGIGFGRMVDVIVVVKIGERSQSSPPLWINHG